MPTTTTPKLLRLDAELAAFKAARPRSGMSDDRASNLRGSIAFWAWAARRIVKGMRFNREHLARLAETNPGAQHLLPANEDLSMAEVRRYRGLISKARRELAALSAPGDALAMAAE